MATPPPVSAADAAAAVDRIAGRRRAIDDPHLWRMGDQPHEVLDYLRRYSSGVPADVAQADVLDGLTLKVRLWWIAEESEWWLLERSRRLGVGPTAVGRVLGVRTRQGVHDRLRLARHKAALLEREPSRESLPVGRGRDGTRSAQLQWLSAHRGAVQDLARRAVAFRDVAGDVLADDLVDVARDLADDALTPGSLQVLRFALIELAADGSVEQAGRGAARDQLLHEWTVLYADYPAG